jgi:hypothetical protein
MPWDATALWVADLVVDGVSYRLEQIRRVAGTARRKPGEPPAESGLDEESLVQPEWSLSGELFVVSDRSNWWNVYRVDALDALDGPPPTLVTVHPLEAEVARPAWPFGQSRYAVGADGTVWFTYSAADGAHLVRVGPDGAVQDDVLPFVSITALRLDGDRLVAVASSQAAEAAVVAVVAVADVDHGGSTGYGRAFRMALAVTDVFAAGASHFGVADLAALAQDTHKFEARYLDRLVGPWSQTEDVDAERSPIQHVDGLDRPLIVLQGDEDTVVPPAQPELIVSALAARRIPHVYLLFAGEQHGFRKAESIVAAVQAELSFYGQVFGFTPAGDVPQIPVEFADRLRSGNQLQPGNRSDG